MGREWVSEIEALGMRLAPHLENRHERPLAIDLQVDGMRLVGQLNGVAATGLLQIEVGQWKANHTVHAWLNHLVLNAAAPAGVIPRTVGVGRKGGVEWTPASEPLACLVPWLQHYRQGLTQTPIPLSPEVLLALRPKDDASAQQAALQRAYRQSLTPAFPSERPPDVYLRWLYGETEPVDAHWHQVALQLVMPILRVQGEAP